MEFSKEFEKLKQISNDIDDENLSLDKSIEKYEEACKIIENCVTELSKAKGKYDRREFGIEMIGN